MKLRVVFSAPGSHRLIDRAEADVRQRIASRTSPSQTADPSSIRAPDAASPAPPPPRRSISPNHRS